MMVQNSEKTLAIALESLGNVYDELIIVDGGSIDTTCDIALSYGAKIIHSKWTGNHSQQRNVYLNNVNTDWIFVLDSDEFINEKTLEFLSKIKLVDQSLSIDTDNFWLQRKWISPFSRNEYIISKPHYPDLQRRLFKYNKNLYYEGLIHEVIHGLTKQGIHLKELSIYHLDLLINNEEKREEKVRKYSKIDPLNGARHYYLPQFNNIKTEEWNCNDIEPSVQALIDTTLNNTILNSELNTLIPAEIKNDEFYDIIKRIASKENLKTVLEIGSSSGGGSTEAFVTGLRENPNQPKLFCMEISKSRFDELQKRYAFESFVKCYNTSSISLEKFPNSDEVRKFYNQTKTNLNSYPLEQVIGWLNQDIEYLKNSGVTQNGIQKIKQENDINQFDIVLIDGSEFTGLAELEEVYGARFILLDDINAFKNHKNHQQLLADPNSQLLEQNLNIRNGYSIFKRLNDQQLESTNIEEQSSTLSINFLTIVLNGEPFIRYHIEIFKQLPFKWHWHIVEGVAELKHDTAWSLNLGGKITDELHHNGRSYDGTTEYLDELARQYPENITVYRKPEGVFWNGKREMVNEPLFNIHEECVLWQVDADELWTAEQICTARQLFIDNPDKTAAFYWCWYFVGENLVISTRNCYAENPQQEWLRTWRYKPGSVWVAHEPPRLAEPLPNGQWRDIASVNSFMHEETEKLGLVFQHFAYVTPEQLRFKEQYYGYKNATIQWQELQGQNQFPVLLRQYFAWIGDTTQVDTVSACGVVPIAQREFNSNKWQFLQPEQSHKLTVGIKKIAPKIIVDGVFFQLYQTGIARVWRSILQEWVNNGFAKHIVFLDRAGTAPAIPGIKYRPVAPYDYSRTDADREMLQQVCDEEGADLFISSYYTTPLSTPSVFMAHDMIPELMGADLNHPMWREKHYGIRHASAYTAVSENTARDLVRFFPDISLESITVAQNGVDHKIFSPASHEDIRRFKTKYGIAKPYFILVGAGSGYKNTILFFKAFAQLFSTQGFDIVCTGSGSLLETEFRSYTLGSTVHTLQLSDEELSIAYSGAVALVYPSKYEGFGLPVLEAIACGCPIITCPNASIPEVAGEAALYVNDEDVDGLTNALCDVQKLSIRKSLSAAGLEQAKKFSWSKMAEEVSTALIDATLLPLNLKDINLIIFPDWSQPEEALCFELEQIIRAIATHPDSSQATLLVYRDDMPEEEAALFLSGVSMNLLMQEDLDISEGLEISLVGQLSEIQWEALLPRIQARIVLENESQEIIFQAGIKNITLFYVDKFNNQINNLIEGSEKILFNKGIALYQQERFAEAVSKFQKTLKIKPDFPQAQYLLSKTRYANQVISKGYQFTQDWFSGNIPIWEQRLKYFVNMPELNVLEIGSWEGRSTCWLIDNIMIHDSSKITCVDTFEGSIEHNTYDTSYLQSIGSRFDFNINKTGFPNKVQKIVGQSHEVLRTLPLNHYNLVYIDGSHVASDVLEDTVLVWQLVKVGGFIIFDDYLFGFPENPAWNTKNGVDAFMKVFNEKFRLIHKAYQIIIEKTIS
jgi:glycosyltransferase involved in cell wall biosynthesis/predicted O-methyltransferase YrrM